MRYAKIREQDISNGPGVRVSLFTQGCDFHCNGCFNKETWRHDLGKEFTYKDEKNILRYLDHEYISGLSILGGEPFIHGHDILNLVENVKDKFPEKSIWIWTGYLYEKLISLSDINRDILEKIDVLVDGLFDINLADTTLKYRGSSNQRVIDTKKSSHNNIVLYCE